jgi:hypothetical protein
LVELSNLVFDEPSNSKKKMSAMFPQVGKPKKRAKVEAAFGKSWRMTRPRLKAEWF